MTHPAKPRAAPLESAVAVSSPVEDDHARAIDVLGRLFMFELGSDVARRIARDYARVRAEAAAAEREAVLEICERFRARSAEAYDIMQAIRARGPAPAQQEETHEKD